MSRGIVAILLLLSLPSIGCQGEGPGVELCPGGCPAGQVCDFSSGSCVPTRPEGCPLDMGRHLSMAADSSGTLHLAFYDQCFGDLVVATWRQGQEPVCQYVDGQGPGPQDPGDDVGLFASLALDELERPRVAYFDRSHGRLKLASSSGQGWQVITVPGTWQQDEVVGWGCSLVLDEQGQPHIAYLNLSSGLPEISRRRPDGSWTSEVVQLEPVAEPGDWQQPDDNVRPLRLLLDRRQVEWLAFWDPRDGGIKVASRQQPGWAVVQVASGQERATWVTAALDESSNLALAYQDRRRGRLLYAANNGGQLQQAVAAGDAAGGSSGAHCRLLFAADGLPRIFYLDGRSADLAMVAGLPAGGFDTPRSLVAAGTVGFFTGAVPRDGMIDVVTVRFDWQQDGSLAGQLLRLQVAGGTSRLGGGRP